MRKKCLILKKQYAASGGSASVKTGKRRVRFEYITTPGRNSSIAGSFNDWDPEAKVLADKNGDGVADPFLPW